MQDRAIYVWDLPRIRGQLREWGLDWTANAEVTTKPTP
jgi:hypothetical protein